MVQAFLDFRGFDFHDFQFNAVCNSILFSSPLVLLNNLDLCGFRFPQFFYVSPHNQRKSRNASCSPFIPKFHENPTNKGTNYSTTKNTKEATCRLILIMSPEILALARFQFCSLFCCLPLWTPVRLQGKKLQNATKICTTHAKILPTGLLLYAKT